MQLIRTPDRGCFQVVTNEYWGTYLAPVNDPDANVATLPKATFELLKDFPKIPSDIFSAIVNLFKHYAHNHLEVAVRFYRRAEYWRCLVPHQRISMAVVDLDYTKGFVDILRGELETAESLQDQGWIYAGDFHSHHTMKCKWSGIDDRDELKNPGMHGLIHSMVFNGTNLDSLTPIASIVLQGVRHEVPAEAVIDLRYDSSIEYSPEVLSMIHNAYTVRAGQLKAGMSSAINHKNKWYPKNFDYEAYCAQQLDSNESSLDIDDTDYIDSAAGDFLLCFHTLAQKGYSFDECYSNTVDRTQIVIKGQYLTEEQEHERFGY